MPELYRIVNIIADWVTQVANLSRQNSDPCYTSYEMEVGLLVGSKSALLANLDRWFPGHGAKAKLARGIGVSSATVTRWFNGTRELSFDDLDKIAAYLKKRPQELIIDYADPKSTGVSAGQALEIIAANLPKDS